MPDDGAGETADLLYGVAAIAGHLSMTERMIYHLHRNGQLPTFKVGGRVCARRSGIAAFFAAKEAAARQS